MQDMVKKSNNVKSNNKAKNIKKNVKAGIESIGFYTTDVYLLLKDLVYGKRKGEGEKEYGDSSLVKKYEEGLGQISMSVITPNEDIVTMAYNATLKCLGDDKLSEDIDLLLFATESAIDNSKSAACELYGLLKHEEMHQCRCIEVKHACYGGTAALMMAKEHILNNPDKKALVVMSDIAFYGLGTKGEPTQGCGAVTILLSSDPKIAVINNDNVFISSNKNDFYRPGYQMRPLYDGKFSIICYIDMFKKVYQVYTKGYGKKNKDCFNFLIAHMPFARMLDKCCDAVKINKEKNKNEYIKYIQKYVGNAYTASLYVGLFSLLVHEPKSDDLYGKKVALFSYGSGAECEMFSITILKDYDKHLKQKLNCYLANNIQSMRHDYYNPISLSQVVNRKSIDYGTYCKLLEKFEEREKNLNWELDSRFSATKMSIEKIENGVRYYRYHPFVKKMKKNKRVN